MRYETANANVELVRQNVFYGSGHSYICKFFDVFFFIDRFIYFKYILTLKALLNDQFKNQGNADIIYNMKIGLKSAKLTGFELG